MRVSFGMVDFWFKGKVSPQRRRERRGKALGISVADAKNRVPSLDASLVPKSEWLRAGR